ILTLFCQPYLSGTHASLEQRITLLEKCLSSGMPQRRTLGLRMLSAGLSGSTWTGSGRLNIPRQGDAHVYRQYLRYKLFDCWQGKGKACKSYILVARALSMGVGFVP
ncbi:hypothetical protein XQ55_26365, partial [Salmonella enterica]|nr:hypothetical protein [Salmonella enterica]